MTCAMSSLLQGKLNDILATIRRPRILTDKLLISLSELSTDDEQPEKVANSKTVDVIRMNESLQNRLNTLAAKRIKVQGAVQDFALPTEVPEEDSLPERVTKKLKATMPVVEPKAFRDVTNSLSITSTQVQKEQIKKLQAPNKSRTIEKTKKRRITAIVHLRQTENGNKENISIEDVTLKKSNNGGKEENITNVRIAKCMKTIHYMNIEVGDLRKELEKRNQECAELKKSSEISQKEEQRLKELKNELQQSCINSCRELKALVNQHRNTPCNPTEEIRYLPSGFIRKDESQIHLGRGVWIAKDTYYLAMSNITSNAMFVKNLAVAVFGVHVILVSTLTGKGSNRNKQKNKSEKQLDSRKVFAIKDFYRWWLLSKKHMKELDADIEADKELEYIRKKIGDMKDGNDNKRKRRQKKLRDRPTSKISESENNGEESNNSIPDDARSLTQGFPTPDEMETMGEEREKDFETDISESARSLAQGGSQHQTR